MSFLDFTRNYEWTSGIFVPGKDGTFSDCSEDRKTVALTDKMLSAIQSQR